MRWFYLTFICHYVLPILCSNLFHTIFHKQRHADLTLFNTIALVSGSAPIAISRLKLTRKQYYSKLSALTNADLITRKNGKYFLTSFGKVVYEAHTLIGRAQQNYWKLKAVDAIQTSNEAPEERCLLINNLTEDNDLKQILLSSNENEELLVQHQPLAVPKISLQNIDL
jgi:hypothetical protein